MANYLSPSIVADLHKQILSGISIRKIAQLFGISINTVQRYRNIVIDSGEEIAQCKCGKPSGHKGWCSYRLEHSKARQLFLEGWVGKRITLSHFRSARLSGGSRKREDVLSYPYVRRNPRHSQQVVLEVYEMLPRNIPHDVRGDMCQDILLAITEGLFTFEEIPDKIDEFAKSARGYLPNRWMEISIFDQVRGTENERIIDTLVDESPDFTDQVKFATEQIYDEED